MGLGKWNGRRHLPITPYEGSWAAGEALRKEEAMVIDGTTARDRVEFRAYCATLTDVQVCNVVRKEQNANRMVYARIAFAEAERRGLVNAYDGMFGCAFRPTIRSNPGR